MKTTWVLASVVVVSGVVAAACGGSGSSGFPLSLDGGGTVGGDATARSLASSSGSGIVLATGTGTGTGAGTGTGSGSATLAGPGVPHGCDPTCAAAGGHCTNMVCVIRENPGAVTAGAQQQLAAAAVATPAFKWVYPYDQTVFPRGLISPTLQLTGGGSPEAVMVHITYSSMDYIGYFGGAVTAQAQLPAASWAAITEGAWATDLVQVSVTQLVGGKPIGPATEHWVIAQGSMRGQIYYETYGSTLAGGPDSVGIMSIAPGATAPTVLKSGCGNVCHTASADGSTLVANVALGFSSSSYDLKSAASTIYSAPSEIFTYGGLYPDGSFVMSATNYRTWFNAPSLLYDTKTGANIPATGWTITNAGTTVFSPDGKHLAFIDEDLDQGAGHSLAMMDFSLSGHAFSNLRQMANDPVNTIGWPAFTPDIQTIVYHSGSNQSFETDDGATGNVYQVDIGTKKSTRLDALDGYTPSGGTYLPANDPDLNFAPTVLPEAVGGYFWVVFTSHRSYGNILPTQDNGDQNGKLWVAALNLTDTPGQDSSHPAFYLDGQESGADNLRGFWVLPPCKASGSGCASGDECCTGFCRGSGSTTCVAEPVGVCSNEYEKCATSADCCNAAAGYECIGGYCSQPAASTPK